MKHFAHFASIAALMLLGCGGPPKESTSNQDTLSIQQRAPMAEERVYEPTFEEPDTFQLPRVDIAIDWQAFDLKDQMGFEPFNKVYQQASLAYRKRDSIFFTGRPQGFTHEDSVLFAPYMDDAYNAIFEYSNQMKAGLKTGKVPSHRWENALRPEDESHNLLRSSTSTILAKADFAFVGGAPFVSQLSDLYKSPEIGNPETHFQVQIPENASFLFGYVYQFHPTPIETSYGGPLSSYDGPEQEVKGIGSILHKLTNRIPVWFLTSEGPVAGSIVSVWMKLGYEYGCISNNPSYTLAASKDIAPEKIFGIFFSNEMSLTNAKNMEVSSSLWEYDLDGDGQADIARINSRFEGASDDNMAQAIWYMRVNDKWVVLDYAAEPDCT